MNCYIVSLIVVLVIILLAYNMLDYYSSRQALTTTICAIENTEKVLTATTEAIACQATTTTGLAIDQAQIATVSAINQSRLTATATLLETFKHQTDELQKQFELGLITADSVTRLVQKVIEAQSVHPSLKLELQNIFIQLTDIQNELTRTVHIDCLTTPNVNAVNVYNYPATGVSSATLSFERDSSSK